MQGKIQILAANKIDRGKWNQCLSVHTNGLIYSQPDYLDHICDHWAGLIIGDYEAVMALPWRRKFGIRYIYQPPFIQQLGMIGEEPVPFAFIDRFANYGDLLLNFKNEPVAAAQRKTNFVIDLSAGYDRIAANYKKDLVLNLKKAEKETLRITEQNDLASAIKMYQLLYQQRMDDLKNADFARFEKLALHLAGNNQCFARKVQDEKGTALAVGLFLKDNRRVYNLMNSTTDIGRTREANHFLLDRVIREFAGQELLFDFEGSDLAGVKSFYEKFGGIDQPYHLLHYNNLPAPLKLLKK